MNYYNQILDFDSLLELKLVSGQDLINLRQFLDKTLIRKLPGLASSPNWNFDIVIFPEGNMKIISKVSKEVKA